MSWVGESGRREGGVSGGKEKWLGREGGRNERKKEKQRKEEEVRRKQSREKEEEGSVGNIILTARAEKECL